jgi:hypothetical protein
MIDVSGWRKRQIALDKKAENARELGLDYEPDKTIIEMAREAGFNVEKGFLLRITGIAEDLERFAALVRADERNRTWTQEHWTEYERNIAAAECEAVIRLLIELKVVSTEGTLIERIRARSQTPCVHEWVDDTKTKPAWRCAKCGIEYTKENT